MDPADKRLTRPRWLWAKGRQDWYLSLFAAWLMF